MGYTMVKNKKKWNTRIWQVYFEVHSPFNSLPMPYAVVEQKATSPHYCEDGRVRSNKTAQLQITTSGVGEIRIKDKVYQLRPGMALLHNLDDSDICYYYPKNARVPWTSVWIEFDHAHDIIQEFNDKHGYLCKIPLDKGVAKKLLSYQNYDGTLQFYSPLEGSKLIMDILAEIVDYFENESKENSQSKIVKDAQKFILENINKEMSIYEIADEIQVSREHLSRVFKTQVGVSLKDYICRHKMRLACDLLIQTNLSCKEIAARLGYSNQSSFSRLFKKTVKMAPKTVQASGCRPEI